MSVDFKALITILTMVFYAVALCVWFRGAILNAFSAISSRLQKRQVEDILLVLFVFGAIYAGGSKGTNGNNHASAVLTGRSHEEEIGCGMRTAGNIDESIRFSSFDVRRVPVQSCRYGVDEL